MGQPLQNTITPILHHSPFGDIWLIAVLMRGLRGVLPRAFHDRAQPMVSTPRVATEKTTPAAVCILYSWGRNHGLGAASLSFPYFFSFPDPRQRGR